MRTTKTKGLLLLLLLSVTALAATPAFAGGGQGKGPSGARVVGVFGKIPGKDIIVHVLAVIPPGAGKNEVAREALRQQGARPWQHDEFSTTGLVWDQLIDADPTNDFVVQNYNPGSGTTEDDPTEGAGEIALLNSHSSWTNVSGSKFAFSYGGQTDRCPSLVRECRGPQFFDGNNDVAWLELTGCCTLGVTWFGISIDEADMALNVDFDWFTDGVNDFDVETVFLHENGHEVGLGHSNVVGAVMEPVYAGVRRVLHLDDIDGITSLYPTADTTAPTVSGVTPADGATGVAVNTNVVVTFSEPLNGVDSTTFTLSVGGVNIASTVTVAGDRLSATLNPSADLATDTLHTVTVTTGVTDDAGNPMAANFTSSFTTVAPPPPATATVTVDEVSARNIQEGQNYRITVLVLNDNSDKPVTITVEVEVLDSLGAVAQTLAPQQVTLDAEGEAELAFNDPSTTVKGTYTARAAVKEDPDVGPDNTAAFKVVGPGGGGDD